MKLDHFLTPYTRISSKEIKDLTVRPQTIKLLEENIGSKLFDITLGNIFGYISLGKENKRKKWMGDYIKLKRFCTAKETTSRTKDNWLHGRKYSPKIQLHLDVPFVLHIFLTSFEAIFRSPNHNIFGTSMEAFSYFTVVRNLHFCFGFGVVSINICFLTCHFHRKKYQPECFKVLSVSHGGVKATCPGNIYIVSFSTACSNLRREKPHHRR